MPLVCLKVKFLDELLSHCEYILLAPYVDPEDMPHDVSVTKLQFLVCFGRVRLQMVSVASAYLFSIVETAVKDVDLTAVRAGKCDQLPVVAKTVFLDRQDFESRPLF